MHMPTNCAPNDRPWSLCGGRWSLHVNVIPFNIVPFNIVPDNAFPDNAVPDAAADNAGPDGGAYRCASHTGSHNRVHGRRQRPREPRCRDREHRMASGFAAGPRHRPPHGRERGRLRVRAQRIRYSRWVGQTVHAVSHARHRSPYRCHKDTSRRAGLGFARSPPGCVQPWAPRVSRPSRAGCNLCVHHAIQHILPQLRHHRLDRDIPVSVAPGGPRVDDLGVGHGRAPCI